MAAERNPTLAKEWNYERNNELTPANVTPGSNKKIWWKCSKGHEWQASIAVRNSGRGCPYCAGKKVLKGYNDLQTVNTFYNQMFNPQYVNAQYYRQIEKMQYQAKQNEEVAKAVKAIHDLCEAVKQLDDQHQQIAFSACLAEMAREFNW